MDEVRSNQSCNLCLLVDTLRGIAGLWLDISLRSLRINGCLYSKSITVDVSSRKLRRAQCLKEHNAKAKGCFDKECPY
jgi:hypothetical protein